MFKIKPSKDNICDDYEIEIIDAFDGDNGEEVMDDPSYDEYESISREFKKPIIGLNLSKRKSFIINPYYSRLNDETGELEFLDFYNEAFDTNMKLATCIKNAK